MNLKQNASSPPVASTLKCRIKNSTPKTPVVKQLSGSNPLSVSHIFNTTPLVEGLAPKVKASSCLGFFKWSLKKWFEWKTSRFLRFLRFLGFFCFPVDLGMIWGWFWDDSWTIWGWLLVQSDHCTQPSQSKSMGSVTRNWWTAVWLSAERTASIFAPKVSSPHLSRP